MVDALQALWRELLGSWWVLVVVPILIFLRWTLTSRWGWVVRTRHWFLSLAFWNIILAAPESPAPTDLTSGDGSHPTPVSRDPAEFRRTWFLELFESGLVALLLVFLVIRPFVVQAFYIPSPSMVETLEVNDRILVNKFIYHVHTPHRGDIVVFEPPPRATDRVEDDWIKRVIGEPGDRISVHDNHLYLNGVPQSEPYVALLNQSSDKPGMVHESTGEYSYRFPDPQIFDSPQYPEDAIPPGKDAYVYLYPGANVQDMRYRVTITNDTQPSATGDYLFFVRNDPREGLEAIVPPNKYFVMGDNRNDSEDSHYWGYLERKRVLGQAFCIFWPVSRAQLLHNPHSS